MIEADEWQLKKFILGVRHQRTFMISDIRGVIADVVLALSKEKPFPKGGLTKVTAQDISAIIVANNDESLSVNCNLDGIIITADLSERFSLTIDKVQQMFVQIIKETLPLTQAEDKINRIGAVYEFHISQLANSAKFAFSEFMRINVQGIPDTALMRISLKNPLAASLAYPDKTNDYENVILTISSEMEKEGAEDEAEESGDEEKKEGIPSILKISADYQTYYVPQRHLKNINIAGHLANAKSFVDNTLKKIPLNVE